MRLLTAFIAGGFFGAGLLISGMTNTQKVQNWLDFLGTWDPTLAFVMGGAIVPMFIAWQIAARRDKAILGTNIPAPSGAEFSGRFITGSILFGMGWALVGLCPGPVIASLGFGGTPILIFLAAMLTGMLLAPYAKWPGKNAVAAE